MQLPQQFLDSFAGQLGTSGYKFLTENRATFVDVTSSSVTLTTTTYREWRDFQALLSLCKNAFVEIYAPPFYSRVGLRYVNWIDRDSLNIPTAPWQDLLHKSILGELGEHFIEQNVEEMQKSIRVRNSDKLGGFLLQHGLFKQVPNGNNCYFIDFDFYADQKTEIANAAAVLDSLHNRSGLAWRWCISPKLHAALGPHDA